MAEWSELPYDLIALVASKLVEVEDFISFSAVCRSWWQVYLNKQSVHTAQIPWIMFLEHDASERKFLSPSTCKWYRISLREAQGSQCWGTFHGWVVIFDKTFAMRLINPINHSFINLPPLSVLWKQSYELDWFTAIQKVIVCKLHGILVTFVIYEHNRSLAFSRCGDSTWTIVPFSITVSLSDVVCLKDQILAVTMAGILILVEINGCESPRAVFVTTPPKGECHWSKVYLAESLNDVLLVFRYDGTGLRLYKLDKSRNRWLRVDDLGGRFLFVDLYSCGSASAYGYFKSNHIYYVSETSPSISLQMIVYNVKNSKGETFWIKNNSPCYTRPVWMTPSLL